MAYGDPDHEAWLIEMEAQDEASVNDVPTRAEVQAALGGCGCLVSMVYGGDCAHTIMGEFE